MEIPFRPLFLGGDIRVLEYLHNSDLISVGSSLLEFDGRSPPRVLTVITATTPLAVSHTMNVSGVGVYFFGGWCGAAGQWKAMIFATTSHTETCLSHFSFSSAVLPPRRGVQIGLLVKAVVFGCGYGGTSSAVCHRCLPIFTHRSRSTHVPNLIICRPLLAFFVESHLPGNSLAEVHLRRLPHVRHGGKMSAT